MSNLESRTKKLIFNTTQKGRNFIANEKIPTLINLNTERNLPHIKKYFQNQEINERKNRKR
jgi:hypothetical protein